MFSYYHVTTEYSCGVDLHSRQMYICVMDKNGKVLVHRNVRGNDFEYFLKLVEPYKHSLTVCCECTFNWYWFADACEDAGFEFVLGHALFVSKCVMSGCDYLSIRDWTGHSSIKMLEDIYGHLNQDFRAKQMSKLKIGNGSDSEKS